MATRTRKTKTERIQDLDVKISQLQNQRTKLIAQNKEEERKKRTRRLIQNGALIEKFLNQQDVEPAQLEKILEAIFSLEGVKAIVNSTSKSSIQIEDVDEDFIEKLNQVDF